MTGTRTRIEKDVSRLHGFVAELIAFAAGMPIERIPDLLPSLHEVTHSLQVRLLASPRQDAAVDQLIGVKEAGQMFGISMDTLYRHEFSFTRHIGRRRLFPYQGSKPPFRTMN